MHTPIMFIDFMEQYRENRITVTEQEDPKSKFRMFINSFLVALITTMDLQRIRAMEALNTNRQAQSCNSGLLKILMILNLVIVVSLLLRKIKKSIFFWGQPFSNTVKIKLFLADTQMYASLDLNQLTGNTHLFKLTGELSLEDVTIKKNWIWDVLEIK